MERAYLEGGDLLAYEREVFGVDHAALAGLFLESWRLPEILCDSVAAHHADGSDRSLARIVQMGAWARNTQASAAADATGTFPRAYPGHSRNFSPAMACWTRSRSKSIVSNARLPDCASSAGVVTSEALR